MVGSEGSSRAGRTRGVGTVRRRAFIGLLVATLTLAALPATTPGVAAAGPLPPAAVYTRGIATDTIYFNRLETRDIARSGHFGGACGIIMAALRSMKAVSIAAGVLCASALLPTVQQAIRAENRGMCLKIKIAVIRQSGGGILPVAAWPDIYRGQYCH